MKEKSRPFMRPLRQDRSRLVLPEAGAASLDREKLLDQLGAALNLKTTVVVAPPGYGKTTLIAQWGAKLEKQNIRVAYYSASDRESDPIAFLGMIAAALHGAGVNMDGLIVSDREEGDSEGLLNEILVRIEQVDMRFILIIDDFDRAEDRAVRTVTLQLIEALPPNVHVVVGSRIAPSRLMTRFGIQGKLQLVETEQLRLSVAEIAHMIGVEPDDDEAVMVMSHTRGWPAAVQLYSIWRSRRLPEKKGERFGSHMAEVADSLTRQVFSTLDDEEIDLLVDIADCDDVESGLVDAMRERNDSIALLERVHKILGTLVNISDGYDGQVYRLHPLLLYQLRLRLARMPEHRSKLAERAARWYAHHHRFADAIRKSNLCKSQETRDEILNMVRPLHIAMSDGAGALRAIMRELTEEDLARAPRLQILAALTHLRAGYFVEAQAMLSRIEASTDGFSKDPLGRPDWLRADGRMTQLLFHGQMSRPSAKVTKAYELAREAAGEDPLLWGLSENIVSLISQTAGDLTAARNAIDKMREVYEMLHLDRLGRTSICGHELLLSVATGNLRETTGVIDACCKQYMPGKQGDVAMPAMLKLCQAAVRYEQKFDEQSVEALRTALTEHGAAQSWFDHYAIVYPAALTYLFFCEGAGAVFHFLTTIQLKARHLGIEALPLFLDFLEISFRVRSGDLATAERMAVDVGLEKAVMTGAPDAVLSWRELDAGLEALVMLRLAESRPDDALKAARRMIDAGKKGARLRSEIKGRVLAALVLREKDLPAARADLLQAVVLALPHGYVAPFAEYGHILGELLKAVYEDEVSCSGLARSHIERIRNIIRLGMPAGDAAQLTEREWEIMSHVADGVSNKVIARRLGISYNTVKFHLKRVFTKWNVTTRRDAAAQFVHIAIDKSERLPAALFASAAPGTDVKDKAI